MKKIIALLLLAALCVVLCSCAPLSRKHTISYNDDASEMYYNGRTYINYHNSNGKYDLDPQNNADLWENIATMPYFYLLGAVTEYYGNDGDNPDFITNTRSFDFYVREDISIDQSLLLSVCDTQDQFQFRITEVTTANVITYDFDKRYDFEEVCSFRVSFSDYPGVKLRISVCEYDGKLYLQDNWDSDYYEITDEFKNDLHRFGIKSFDYKAKGV